jgi:hypothetical protein
MASEHKPRRRRWWPRRALCRLTAELRFVGLACEVTAAERGRLKAYRMLADGLTLFGSVKTEGWCVADEPPGPLRRALASALRRCVNGNIVLLFGEAVVEDLIVTVGLSPGPEDEQASHVVIGFEARECTYTLRPELGAGPLAVNVAAAQVEAALTAAVSKRWPSGFMTPSRWNGNAYVKPGGGRAYLVAVCIRRSHRS